MVEKIDSNVTGLSFAEEASLGVLPGSPVWHTLEPNSYADFGGQIKTVARNPINQTRQRKKGVITDLDASGGFNQDLTFENTTRLLQGFMFANMREKFTTAPLNSAAIPITSVDAATDVYAAASGLSGLLALSLVYASGFTNPANNGLKLVASASTGTTITVGDGTVDEAAPPADRRTAVGQRCSDAFVGRASGMAVEAALVHAHAVVAREHRIDLDIGRHDAAAGVVAEIAHRRLVRGAHQQRVLRVILVDAFLPALEFAFDVVVEILGRAVLAAGGRDQPAILQ